MSVHLSLSDIASHWDVFVGCASLTASGILQVEGQVFRDEPVLTSIISKLFSEYLNSAANYLSLHLQLPESWMLHIIDNRIVLTVSTAKAEL